MGFRPALRADLQLVREAGETAALYDPVLDRRVHLGPVSRAVLALLDGERTAEALIDEVLAGAPAWERAQVEHSLRCLLLMGLLAGAGAAILERARAVRGGQVTLAPVVLPGTRFSCQGSGGCCKGYVFGPLTERDVARIEALDVAAAYPHLGPGPYLQERLVDGGRRRWFLRTTESRCVFLLPDERCGLHAAFGAGSKPGLCRLYPYQVVPTIDGLRIYDRGECSVFSLSSTSGPEARDEAASLLGLLQEPQGPLEPLEIEHPLVFLDGRTPCDYGHFLRLQDALCAQALQPGRRAPEALRAAAGLLCAFAAALTACPLAPGEPERTVAAVLAGAGPPPPSPDPARGLRALRALVLELLEEIGPSIALADYNPDRGAYYAQLKDLGATLEVLHARAGAPSPSPPLADPRLDALLRRSLASRLFGRQALLDGHPAAALLRSALAMLITVVRAQALSEARGRSEVGLAEFDAGHKLAQRSLTLNSLGPVFIRHEQALWDIAAAVAEIF